MFYKWRLYQCCFVCVHACVCACVRVCVRVCVGYCLFVARTDSVWPCPD